MKRRTFLSVISCSLAKLPASPLVRPVQRAAESACWLDVCAPFMIEDESRGVSSEILLTADSFIGVRGYEDGLDSTDYEIFLYDAAGHLVTDGGVARRLRVPAMRPARVSIGSLVDGKRGFWGGMKIRMRPSGREQMHVSDLFSSAFARWRSAESFDNVHANPDPPQWQSTESFFYSMPFPSLADYECVFSLFNPNDLRSAGQIAIYDRLGQRIVAQRFELKPHASLLFDLNARGLIDDPLAPSKSAAAGAHGSLAVTNEQGSAKSFGYLMIRRNDRRRFSVEHPIHQGVFVPKPLAAPFDANQQFKAKNVLYSPLLFNGKKLGGLTLETRYYFGAGLPLEEAQWLYPFAVDGAGNAAWSAMNDPKLSQALPGQTERGVIRLAANQSCELDPKRLSLDPGFSGGLAVAVSPEINHTLFKVEIRVREWGAHAFTHFRPGLRSARLYQKPRQRGGLATDYVVSGARLVRKTDSAQYDELIGLINIDDQGVEAQPTLEIFTSQGLVKRQPLGSIPPFACRHFLLSDLIIGDLSPETMTLRLVDQRATLLMSAIHLDYQKRDLALDHGSDRFSTFIDYGCA